MSVLGAVAVAGGGKRAPTAFVPSSASLFLPLSSSSVVDEEVLSSSVRQLQSGFFTGFSFPLPSPSQSRINVEQHRE